MSVIVSLALASICFTYQGTEECSPVLLGKHIPTPTGEFHMIQRLTDSPGYGGDVLQFFETDEQIYSIHRLWRLKPNQKREQRIRSDRISDHFITSGCINVLPEVYEKLLDCCSNQPLIIK